ncbi:MAG: xanthine dehydrogenase family protein molybdopterin-binding subunit, partial [Nitrososphaerales archaeon]
MALQPELKSREEDFLHIGKSYSLLESPLVVTGNSSYPSDIQLPRMLFGKILRSEHAHAKILSIDATEARKLAGVVAVITGSDLPDVRYGSAVKDRYIIARDTVRFVGEAVAAVAATDSDIAEEALRRIKISYQVLPSVFDAEIAMSPDAPAIIHPEYDSYSTKSAARVYASHVIKGVPNLCNHYSIRRGDVEAGFANSDLILENRFVTGFAQHCALEPHSSVAQTTLDGGVIIWTGAIIPHRIVKQVSETLCISPSNVRIMQMMVGGSYGVKCSMEIEPICAALSLKTRRPVKIVLSRKEEFLTVVRHPFVVYVKDGVKKDGTLVARSIKCVLNGGAYTGDSGNAVTKTCAFGTTSTYRIPNFSFDSYRVFTNLPVSGAFRGFGSPQVIWAIEQQMDMAAFKLGIDPVEIRLRNLLDDGDTSVLGERMHAPFLKECLLKAAEAIKWREAPKTVGDWKIAKGIAIGTKYSRGDTIANAEVKLEPDGGLTVIVTAVDSGQGLRTVLSQIAGEVFQIPIESVRVAFPDTAYTPYDDGTISSRGTYTTGNAVKLACEDLKSQMLKAAAKKLQASVDSLDISNGKIRVVGSERSLAYEELFTTSMASVPGFVGEEGEYLGRGKWIVRTTKMDPETSQPVDLKLGQEVRVCSFYTPGAQAAEVAVNVRTGEIKVLK